MRQLLVSAVGLVAAGWESSAEAQAASADHLSLGVGPVVGLAAVANEVVEELRRAEPDRDVNFSSENNLCTRGDLEMIRNLMRDLIGSAWKFTAGCDPAVITFSSDNDGGSTVTFSL